MGRRSKLTREVCEKICTELRGGCSLLGAAEAAGISESTLYNWKNLGETTTKRKYVEFLESIKKADAEGMVTLVREVKDASRQHWQAAAWLLERKWPDLWGKKERIDVAKQKEEDIELVIKDEKISKAWTETLKELKRIQDESSGSRTGD